MRTILTLLLFVFAGSMAFGQSNSYTKGDVMDQITNLNDYTQTWVDQHFNDLNDAQVQHFIDMSTMNGITTTYATPFAELKRAMSSEDFDNAMKGITEERLKQLFDDYNIVY